jgi:uncharacterized protein YndB with AHSA1/START domain
MPATKFQLSDHYGSFSRSGDAYCVRFERILEHPVKNVWEAITRPEQMSLWLAPTEIDLKVGGEVKVNTKGGQMGGKIIRLEKNALLEYSWNNGSIVRWELFTEGEGRCRLLFTHSLLNVSQLKGAATGWHYHMDALTMTLDGQKMPDWPIEVWEEISGDASLRYTSMLREIEQKDWPAADPLIMERTFNAPIGEVWKAITGKEEMKQWYFDIMEFRPEVGFEFTFTADADNKKYVHYCRITEVIPGRKLSYTWRHRNILGISLLTFELSPEGQKTRLRLTHEGLESFAYAGPDFARASYTKGWTYYLDTALKGFLARHAVRRRESV